MNGPLAVLIHPGSDGAFSLYEDAGNTFNYRRGEYMRLDFTWSDRQRRLGLRLRNGLAGETPTRDLMFSGRTVETRL